MQELLSNDPRSYNQQNRSLELKKKKTEQAPRRQFSRGIQNEDELTVNVKELHDPNEQNFVTRAMFHFCPKQQCINNISY